MNRFSWAALTALSLSPLLAGCPSNACLLTVNGKCSWSTCPDGAEYNTARRTCLCAPNRVALNGACLTYEAANQYCGKGAHFENGGCAANKCPPGLEIDQDTGYCITPQQANQVATNMGVQVGQNQKLGCPAGEQLVVEGQQAACVPIQQTCGRDEAWDGRACKKTLQCPPGSGYDARTNACVKFATSADSKELTVDLPTWVRTSYGPDGGDGASGFCGAFNKHPIAFGVKAGATMRVKVALQVQAPDGQVPRATITSAATVDPGGQAVSSNGATLVQQAAQATLSSLVASGGKASVISAATTVTCKIVNSSQPTAVTVSGGL
jgi:hypothetical protein